MKPTRILSRAPTRIDLAGGTVDIWPIYLMLENAQTINLGINLFAETDLTLTEGTGRIHFESADQGHSIETEINRMDGLNVHPALILHHRLLRHIARRFPEKATTLRRYDLKITTRAKSPAGAGLGGSSALSVSIINAYWQALFPEQAPNPLHLVEIVRDVETTVIQVPAGLQDYYGATFGGIQRISWNEALHDRKSFSNALLPELESRILLFYSGHSRNSGINNWQLFKSFIDHDAKIISSFQEIVQSTHELGRALEANDFGHAVRAIQREWSARKTLAAGISTSEIDQAFAIARSEGSVATKICGAGGGGCFFIFMENADPSLKARIQEKVLKSIPSIKVLPFSPVPIGVHVQ